MIITFEEVYLKELYETGQTSDKKHRYQPGVAKRYKDRVNLLKKIAAKEELFPIKSLHFEALRGDKRGLYSVRVNDQYRVEFSLNEDFEHPILTVCNIVELSNHYN